MIYIIVGLIITVLFLCLYIAKIQGYKLVKGEPMAEIPDYEKRRIEQLEKEFEEVLNYNLTRALERKE